MISSATKNKIFLLFVISFFIACQLETKKSRKNTAFENSTNKVALKKIARDNCCCYLLSINNGLCEYQDTILKFPLEEESFHHLEFLKEDNLNILFYEYTSVRPVYYKTIFFSKNNKVLDSLHEGTFDFSISDFKTTSLKINKPICESKLKELSFTYR